MELSSVEVRILGVLIEKEHTTPDYYPLTMNGLLAACNQKSNRDPVMQLDESTVMRALDHLRDQNLARSVKMADSRVMKYEENLAGTYDLTLQETAVLGVLMLRGAQTPGELRGRTNRIYPFEDLGEVQVAIDALMEREAGPLVARLPVQPGRKEARYAHLLSGEPDVPAEEERVIVAAHSEGRHNNDVAALQEQVAALTEEVAELRQQFETFKSQFE